MSTVVKAAALVAVGFLVGPPAQALTVTLDAPNQTIARPSSGSSEVFFYGTVSYGDDEVFDGSNLFFPRRSGAQLPLLQPSAFCPDSRCSTGGTGLLFSILVPSTVPLGLYDLDFDGNPATFGILALNEATGIRSSVVNSYSVRVVESVVPLPAAAWLLLSGLGGLGFLGRRRKAA